VPHVPVVKDKQLELKGPLEFVLSIPSNVKAMVELSTLFFLRNSESFYEGTKVFF